MERLNPCEEMVRGMARSESVKVKPGEGVVQYKSEPRFKGKKGKGLLPPKRGLIKKTVFGDIVQIICSFLRQAIKPYFTPEPQVTKKGACKNKKKIFTDEDGMGLHNPVS